MSQNDKTELGRSDPRLQQPASSTKQHRSRQSSIEKIQKAEKVSIYEQGSIDRNAPAAEPDIDIRGL